MSPYRQPPPRPAYVVRPEWLIILIGPVISLFMFAVAVAMSFELTIAGPIAALLVVLTAAPGIAEWRRLRRWSSPARVGDGSGTRT